ncbi:energy-coupling factor ABC transporter permease [Streptomyces sp. NPDC094448]|uniref:energy-coupling factor ABC transporter permease n=1 Tax=Streptomyces sp. NPDC094448 TaxID=3366063 RepID=UPI003820DF4E
MHVPDGFINAPVSAAAGAVAVVAVAAGLRGARRETAPPGAGADPGGERTAPLAGLVAAFVFAVQMLNFPVAAGTSGHLLGGALAAILVGPYTGLLCLAVVLLLQSVLFADGGLTALGVNITLIGVVTVVVAYGLFRGLLAVLPRRRSAITAATFVAALVSVPVSAVAFTLLYGIGGTTDVPFGTVLAAMTGVHLLIGIGEALITTATVGAVLAVRPDLVYGARDRVAVPLKLRVGGRLTDLPAPPAARAADAPRPAPRRPSRAVALTGLAVAVVLAGFVSFYASASPDGLERVAIDKGFADSADDHATMDWPLADYSIADIADDRLSGGLAGVIGVVATVAAGTLLLRAASARRSARAGAQRPDGGAAPARAATGQTGPSPRADTPDATGTPRPATTPPDPSVPLEPPGPSTAPPAGRD